MVTASELLNSLTNSESDPHIIIGKDRHITVPDSLKRIAVEHDKDIETVTFDCPRYWDEHDLSQMTIYINYRLPDGAEDAFIASNVIVEDDIMHFDWVIGANIAQTKGQLAFIVCIAKTDDEGNITHRWHSELCTDLYVSEGMECVSEIVESEYPDIVTQLLGRMSVVEGYYDEMVSIRDLAYADSNHAAASAYESNQYAEEAKVASDQAVEYANNAADMASEVRNSYANAIKGTASGELVQVDDVSPLEHDVKCWVHGKNLFDISKITSTDLVTNNGDGTLTIAANAYYCRLAQKLSDLCPALKVGDIATFNMTTDSSFSKYIYLHGLSGTWNTGMSITITDEILNSYVCLYGYTESDPLYGQQNILSNIQIEKGVIATEYEPFIDPTILMVTRCGKNLLHVDSMLNTFLTKSGDVYTFKKGTNAGDRFTNTASVYIPADTEICVSAIFDDYTVTDGTLYMIFTYEDGTQAFPGLVFKEKYRYIRLPKAVVSIQFYIQGTQEAGSYIAFRKLQLEIGTEPTVYEPYTVDEGYPSNDGSCAFSSASPTMVIYAGLQPDLSIDIPGIIIEAEYNRDTTKMFESYVLTDKAKSEIVAEIEDDLGTIIDSLTEYANVYSE